MKVGVIGLGRMGNAVAYRLIQGGQAVFGFDIDEEAKKDAESLGVRIISSLQEMAKEVDIFWLMVPAGKIVDSTLNDLKKNLKKDDILIDGGNSKFTDSIRRAEELKQDSIYYLDCGTSGGLRGREIGFSLMIGGNEKAYEKAKPIFKAIAAPDSFGLVGPSGAGHYVKMVHNGIEYALLQAYAEGFHLLKDGYYSDLDLEKISRIWSKAAVVRSWILDLAHNVFKEDQELKSISGEVGGGQTGRWTVQEAEKQHIPVPLIKEALEIRDESKKTGGNYATKLVALLRNQFGGHSYKTIESE